MDLFAPVKIERSPEELTRFVKGLAAYHGAVASGVCELQPYHIYSHVGRGPGGFGAPITLTHRYAIAFAVEMNHAMISAAPRIPAVMESAREYVEAGKIAVILAAANSQSGLPRPGPYRRQLPGDRTPGGQRRRSGRDRSDGAIDDPETLAHGCAWQWSQPTCPLNIDQPTFNPTVIDFCDRCQKCVEVCPSDAIPAGERTEYSDDTLRWKIDSEQVLSPIGPRSARTAAAAWPSAPTLIPIHSCTT